MTTKKLLITESKKLLITESKKRGYDDDFNVEDDDAGKEIKRRPRMEYWGIREDCERALPKMIRRGGYWNCENKPKIHQTCLRNLRGGRDCQKKTPPLPKEKENCRSTTAAIDHACTTTTTSLTVDAHQLSPTKALRAAQMKKRYAHIIVKAHQALMPLNQGDVAHHLKQQQEKERLAEKARIEDEIKAAQTLLRMRAEFDLKIKREAARIALDKMVKTVEFNDALQITRDFESLLNATDSDC